MARSLSETVGKGLISTSKLSIPELGALIEHLNLLYVQMRAKEGIVDCVGKHLYILGDGGYSKAVQSAARSLNINHTIVRRDSWSIIETIKDSTIYNCTPVNLKWPPLIVDKSNTFIDCLVTSDIGKKIAGMQASHQFKMYTGLEFPLG